VRLRAPVGTHLSSRPDENFMLLQYKKAASTEQKSPGHTLLRSKNERKKQKRGNPDGKSRL
jgi:hypothetical protein